MVKLAFPVPYSLLLALVIALALAAPAPASAQQPGSFGPQPGDDASDPDGDPDATGDPGSEGEGDGTGDTDTDGTGDGDPGDPITDDAGTGPDATDTIRELREENARLLRQYNAARAELQKLQDTKKDETPKKPETRVSAGIKLATIITLGNSDTVTLDGGVKLSIENPYEYEFSTAVTYQFIESDGATEQNKLFHVVGFDYLPNDTFSPFVFASHGFEEKRKITYEIKTGIGVKYTPLRDPWDPLEYDKEGRFKYSISLAVLLDHQQFQPNANTDHRTFIRLSLWLKGEQKLADGLFISDKFTFEPAVEDFTNWDLSNTISINVVIEKRYTIDFSWTYSEDSTPAASVQRVDQEFKVGINVKLK